MILGILNAFTTVKPAIIFSFHLSVVSLATFALYAYRDIWPLMTFTLRPADEAEGRALWGKVALALLSGVILPALEPYPYIPVDATVSVFPSLFSCLIYLPYRSHSL